MNNATQSLPGRCHDFAAEVKLFHQGYGGRMPERMRKMNHRSKLLSRKKLLETVLKFNLSSTGHRLEREREETNESPRVFWSVNGEWLNAIQTPMLDVAQNQLWSSHCCPPRIFWHVSCLPRPSPSQCSNKAKLQPQRTLSERKRMTEKRVGGKRKVVGEKGSAPRLSRNSALLRHERGMRTRSSCAGQPDLIR